MLRVLIFAILILGISACEHEHTDTNQATIALTDIKKTKTTNLEEEKERAVNVAPSAKEVPVAMEKTVALEETKEVQQKVVEEEKITLEKEAKAVKKEEKKSKKKRKKPAIKFAKTTHYFGLIDEGETITTKFWFDNVGNAPLLIKDASATCGCTYPGYPFVPIKPGERSSINVSFNSKGKFGKQKPVVTVMTNASSKPIKLYLEGEVKTEVVEN